MADQELENPARLLTFRAAAEKLGLGYHHIQRAARRGLIPVYRFGDRRPRVRLSDIIAVIEASKNGGAK